MGIYLVEHEDIEGYDGEGGDPGRAVSGEVGYEDPKRPALQGKRREAQISCHRHLKELDPHEPGPGQGIYPLGACPEIPELPQKSTNQSGQK